jgi:lysophospholipase L1-like esterase
MKPYKTLLFTALVIALLAALCAYFPTGGVQVGSLNLHFPTLTKILNPQKQLDVEAFLARQDSLEAALKTRSDSLAHYRLQVDSSDIRFWFPNNDDSFFDALFADLEQTRHTGRTIRIVHYGDSQIEMDRMTNRLRAYMQNLFGGGGPGLVPFATLIPSLSVSTYGTGSLVRQSPFGDSTVVRANGNYGPMVQDFHLAGSASSTITAGTHRSCDDHLRQFSQFKIIFCNRPGPFDITFTDRRSGYSDNQRQEEPGVHAFQWKLDSATTSVRLNVSGEADIYGILVDDGPGVAVDNIPMRGCSGHQFTQINRQQLADAYSQMDIGLIILQFGGNSVPYLKSQKSIDAYCTNMGHQIDRLRSCCPKAGILFVGPSDMSTGEEGEIHTYPILPKIIEALRDTVNAHGAAYWSIYDAMGGYNSMAAWVEKGLGGADYVHFSQRGVDIMGDRLAKAFDNMYNIYKMRKEISDAQD